jgi:hypothetical protein
MTKFIAGPLPDRSWNLLRRMGYAEQKVVGEEIGFTRRLQQEAFPRYHAYTEEKDGGMVINLHLDQRATTHGRQRAHGGEYSGMLVEREMQRLVEGIERMRTPPPAPRREEPPASGGWLSRLFG